MKVLPVVERELRAAARQPFTYTLRLAGVALLLGVGIIAVTGRSTGLPLGTHLFRVFHRTLFVAIWALVPLLTADCLSRERREGTLALLFLTPLAPRDIVVAKSLAHGLRAFTLWLAVLPVFTVPFLAGGVAGRDVLVSVVVNGSAMCLALGAGILASSTNKQWVSAMVTAMALSLLLACLLVLATGHLFAWFFIRGKVGASMPWLTTDYIFLAWAGTVFGAFESWEFLVARSTGGNRLLFLTDSSMALGSILVLLLAVLVAAWRVARVWREESPPALVVWVWRKLSTPVLGQALLHGWMRWELNRNPIGWLELRTWRGRLVMWSWFAIVISLYSSLLANLHLYQHIFHGIQSLLAWLLVGTIGLSAAGSFRRERESGALELLLVAPLREWQVIGGRLRGLWTQFLPSAGLLLALWRYCSKFLSDQDELASMVFFAGTFITLPVVGLYFSLARTNFISAFTWTLFVGVAVPSTLGGNLGFLHPLFWHWQVLAGAAGTSQENFAPTFLQAGIAVLMARRLHRNLKFRSFALESGSLP